MARPLIGCAKNREYGLGFLHNKKTNHLCQKGRPSILQRLQNEKGAVDRTLFILR
jgi:hypothetical protein